MSSTAFSEADVAVIWHDTECGVYGADLPLWEELAGAAGGGGGADVLDLGAGTGRVALHLARRGHRICAVDRDPVLVTVMRERAEGTAVTVVEADARGFDLGARSFDLVAAPMQLAHLLDAVGRAAMLDRIAAHLRPDGRAAIALMQSEPEAWVAGEHGIAPAPDVRERDAWIFSSLPIAIEVGDEEVVIRRLRQIVSPGGELAEEPHTFTLARVSPEQLEDEARAAGLAPAGRREVPETEDHVGSTVVLLEAPR